MKIYVGCPIQCVPKRQWDSLSKKIEWLKDMLRSMGHDVLNFRSNSKRKAKKGSVFPWDHKQCMSCDAMIAVVLGPSTGVGMEMILCLSRLDRTGQRPNPAVVIAVAPEGSNTSRMVTECDLPGFAYREFGSWTEIPTILTKNYVRCAVEAAAVAANLPQRSRARRIRSTT